MYRSTTHSLSTLVIRPRLRYRYPSLDAQVHLTRYSTPLIFETRAQDRRDLPQTAPRVSSLTYQASGMSLKQRRIAHSQSHVLILQMMHSGGPAARQMSFSTMISDMGALPIGLRRRLVFAISSYPLPKLLLHCYPVTYRLVIFFVGSYTQTSLVSPEVAMHCPCQVS